MFRFHGSCYTREPLMDGNDVGLAWHSTDEGRAGLIDSQAREAEMLSQRVCNGGADTFQSDIVMIKSQLEREATKPL